MRRVILSVSFADTFRATLTSGLLVLGSLVILQTQLINSASAEITFLNTWGGSGDGSRSADEMRALEVLELDADADFTAIKKAWRDKAKTVHPDVKPGDKEAAAEFQKLQLAYEVLKAAEDRREWRG